MRRSRFALAFVAVTVAGIATIVACSSNDPKPGPAEGDRDGGDRPWNPVTSGDATAEGSTDATTDGDSETVIPVTCSNTIRDGNETDADCGGNECGKCIDGKTCINDADCAGASCVDKVCTTANCKDGIKNGKETDTDCGGGVCPRCTIGKKCGGSTDCASGACNTSQGSCACPPTMAIVSMASGGAYCIDQAEITKGQYNKFLTANVDVADQTAVCKGANDTFVPRGAWPPATTPPALNPTGLPFSLSLPVHYVDWCDAYAYCKWAGKQMCGQINGGPVAPDNANSATSSAWYNACSAQGKKPWPYGTAFIDYKCNGNGAPDGGVGPENGITPPGLGYGYHENQDDGVFVVTDSDRDGNWTVYKHAECQGGSLYLFQMSGNVGEWEDSCADNAATDTECRVRGGSYAANDDPTKLACKAVRTEKRIPAEPGAGETDPLADVGIRCCLY